MERLIYLDSGTINRIADGKCDPGSVGELHEVMRATQSTLLLSLAHAWDFCNGTDAATRRRVASAIDAFPGRALVCDGPEKFERQALNAVGDGKDFDPTSSPLDRWSPKILPLSDFHREIFDDASIARGVDAIISLARNYTGASVLETGVRRQSRAERRAATGKSRGNRDLLERVQTAILAATSPAELRDTFARLVGALPEPDRERARALAEPILEGRLALMVSANESWRNLGMTPERAAQVFLKQHGLLSVDFAGALIRGGMDRWYEIAIKVAPAHAIKVRLAEAGTADDMRNPKVSDQADRLHVQYIPYVDLLVTDANNIAAIEPIVKKIGMPRRAIAIRDPGRNIRVLIERIGAMT